MTQIQTYQIYLTITDHSVHSLLLKLSTVEIEASQSVHTFISSSRTLFSRKHWQPEDCIGIAHLRLHLKHNISAILLWKISYAYITNYIYTHSFKAPSTQLTVHRESSFNKQQLTRSKINNKYHSQI